MPFTKFSPHSIKILDEYCIRCLHVSSKLTLWNRDGITAHYFSRDFFNKMLLTDANSFMIFFGDFVNKYPKHAERIVNETTVYHGWYGTLGHDLTILVGELDDCKGNFYGSKLKQGICKTLGWDIFMLLIKAGLDLNIVNYYDKTPCESILSARQLRRRSNNIWLKNLLKNIVPASITIQRWWRHYYYQPKGKGAKDALKEFKRLSKLQTKVTVD